MSQLADDDDELRIALGVLQRVAADRGVLAHVSRETREQLQRLCGEVARPDLKARKKLHKELSRREHQQNKAKDEALRQQTGIRSLRSAPVFAPALLPPQMPPLLPPSDVDVVEPLHQARKCYVCKREYREIHSFYDQMCRECGDFNLHKRTATVDLRGRIALVTGARVKIGFQGALLLLRAGCTVVACTRFPHDAALRYAREPDFSSWSDRLQVYGLDLRHTPSVERLAQHLSHTLPRLDFQIHNACQTVKRPPGFYAHLMAQEQLDLGVVDDRMSHILEGYRNLRQHVHAHTALAQPARLSQTPGDDEHLLNAGAISLFPAGAFDADLQQVDLRTHNSWRLTLGEVPTHEMLEVLLTNAAAPFVLASKLKPLMLASTPAPAGSLTSHDDARHIVMVSAMEGQFYRAHKTDKHPHTNMAKAALNMVVRTSSSDYAKDRIYLNAVDTGWVTDEDPVHLASKKVQEHAFSPPLDIVDGAARIVDPIFEGFRTGAHAHGVFFKDYKLAAW